MAMTNNDETLKMAIDVNTPVTNPALVEAMNTLRLATKNGTMSAEIYAAFAKEAIQANFLSPVVIDPIPGPPDNAAGNFVLKEGATIKFAGIADAAGKHYLPVFTDWTELGKWRNEPNQQTLISSFEDIVCLIQRDGCPAMIDPLTQSFVLDPEQIELIRRACGLLPPMVKEIVVEQETNVLTGEPAPSPEVSGMKNALTAFFKQWKRVKKAWFLLMQWNEEFSYLLIVDFSGDRRQTFDAIYHAVQPSIPEGKRLDMVPFEDGFGKNAARNHKPFYKKGFFG